MYCVQCKAYFIYPAGRVRESPQSEKKRLAAARGDHGSCHIAHMHARWRCPDARWRCAIFYIAPRYPTVFTTAEQAGHVTVAVHVPNNSTSTQNSNGEAASSSSKKTSKKQPGGKTEPIPKGLEAEELKDGDKAPGSARRILQEAWPFRASLAVGTVYLVLGSIFFMICCNKQVI